MFEVSGNDIANLGDADLRTLVARLALAELRVRGGPLSSVTAGGNQDAADGGLDVRVECKQTIANSDFVPRRATGFQVKKPDMPAGAIRDEMRPNDRLREVISELADASGAYIIVSAQGTVADKRLNERRQAMREALHDLPNAAQLHTDFYDRDRLAIWINEYPGIAAWVRSRVGCPLSGWSSMGDWSGAAVVEASPYLSDDKACLIDERSREREHLTIGEGVARLRAALRIPQQCVRLVGLSGLGKTRLVQALFESGVGDEPLEPSLAIYTDYSEPPDPIAREMARMLISERQRAILIVDNCNPATHSELARLCSDKESKVSLLTVEYDVRDDEPERTEVFRLQASSIDLIEKWIEQSFQGISQPDRERISEFSGGNFRVARALAETLRKGETLGKLKNRDLFARIFEQRNDPDQQLLYAAEDLALLYSINGDDVSTAGELAAVASIRGIAPVELYAALVKLRRRGVVQARSQWRAILPQAIANPLASYAIERIPVDHFDRFSANLTPRMIKSLSRRLGFLHDNKEVQAIAARWMQASGPLGDLLSLGKPGLDIVANITPVAPDIVLKKLEAETNGPNSNQILAPDSVTRSQWIQLIKALAYDTHMFESAMLLLAKFVAVEPVDCNNGSARRAFTQLFQLLLSGTIARPEQRRAAIVKLARSDDPALQRCASLALRKLLKTGHFSSSGSGGFGARSRDWGWHPKTHKDVSDWFNEAIALAMELVPILTDAADILAGNVRGLWQIHACQDTLDHVVNDFLKTGSWIKGWLAFRTTMRFDGEGMPEGIRERLKDIIHRLQPSDLLHRARAIVLNGANTGWDFADGEPEDGDPMHPWQKASQIAIDIGRALAADDVARGQFLSELLIERQAQRTFECCLGLAEGAGGLPEMWKELVEVYSASDPTVRNPTVLGGFLHGGHRRDSAFAAPMLEASIDDPNLASLLPYLQAQVAIDADGISRLRRSIAKGALSARDFFIIATSVVGEAPPDALAELLREISDLPDGVETALDILHMYFYCDQQEGVHAHNSQLISIGRDLLERVNFSKRAVLRDYGLGKIIRICLAGEDGKAAAQRICTDVRGVLEDVHVSSHDLSFMLKALFQIQPFVALDQFLLVGPTPRNPHLFDAEFGSGTPIEKLDSAVLSQWADINPQERYPLLGQSLGMFPSKNHEEENVLSPLFLNILERAPDKRRYLGEFWRRLYPRSGWSGSLANILIQRKAQVMQLAMHADADVRQWITELQPLLDHWIEVERGRDREGEQSFE